MTKFERKLAEKRGRRAEMYAQWLLSLKGYQVVQMCYKTKSGEIDIIARKKNILVFVEVKARKDIEAAELSLYPQMQKRIETTGRIFIARTDWAQSLDIRYDAVFVVPGFLGLPKLVHQKDAWRAW